ncbi:BRO1 domain-containing protein BROX-like [Trichogramma pretiosum]|uniref:BRO1 domain-containing protein BROX-like n=1 Tax=Trichogramma pretiosum TaxID=7493 RepID=UPI0006C9A325|nr:BRO1 domain-containing protein BROX-like [Trichogramma pretiosum]
MAHWFHRNVLKATTPHKFELKHHDPTDASRKLCNDLKNSRNRLLELIKNPNNDSTMIEPAYTSYLQLLYGFIWEVDGDGDGKVGRPPPSKLRDAFIFKWTHTLLGASTVTFADAVYEAANMSINVGLWFMKHAAMIAAKEDITMDEAKEVHSMLRRAAGIFTFVQTEFLPQLTSPPPLGSDLDSRVVNAYINQCTAEAQEVTVARAVELKHNVNLISALSNETSKLFNDAANTLRPFKAEISGQWIKYLELKSMFYKSYAYSYCGDNLLAMDKCGQAIRALKESKACLEKSMAFCKEYSKTTGPAPRVKPDQHLVFKRLAPLVQRTLDKCERENSLIYHDPVVHDVPPLDSKATFGLVSPITFQMPSPDNLWNLGIYKTLIGFETAKISKEQDLPPVKEEEIPQNNKDPKNESGCNLQ